MLSECLDVGQILELPKTLLLNIKNEGSGAESVGHPIVPDPEINISSFVANADPRAGQMKLAGILLMDDNHLTAVVKCGSGDTWLVQESIPDQIPKVIENSQKTVSL
jgi:hypothetical protein